MKRSGAGEDEAGGAGEKVLNWGDASCGEAAGRYTDDDTLVVVHRSDETCTVELGRPGHPAMLLHCSALAAPSSACR